jgi:hypothetical protein
MFNNQLTANILQNKNYVLSLALIYLLFIIYLLRASRATFKMAHPHVNTCFATDWFLHYTVSRAFAVELDSASFWES